MKEAGWNHQQHINSDILWMCSWKVNVGQSNLRKQKQRINPRVASALKQILVVIITTRFQNPFGRRKQANHIFDALELTAKFFPEIYVYVTTSFICAPLWPNFMAAFICRQQWSRIISMFQYRLIKSLFPFSLPQLDLKQQRPSTSTSILFTSQNNISCEFQPIFQCQRSHSSTTHSSMIYFYPTRSSRERSTTQNTRIPFWWCNFSSLLYAPRFIAFIRSTSMPIFHSRRKKPNLWSAWCTIIIIKASQPAQLQAQTHTQKKRRKKRV